MRTIKRPIVGVREWYVDPTHHELISGFSEYSWEPGRDERAKCCLDHLHGPGGTIPDKWCTCGLHAYYDLQTLLGNPNSLLNLGTAPMGGVTVGVVSAWGRVFPAGGNFRAERMRIEAIVDHAAGYPGIAEVYKVPYIQLDEVHAFMELSGGTRGREVVDANR